MPVRFSARRIMQSWGGGARPTEPRRVESGGVTVRPDPDPTTSGAAGAPRRYSVLLYCARSGSTFFAHRLAEADPRIAVVPEFRLASMLIWRSEAGVKALTPSGLQRLMDDDVQFGNLRLPEGAAADIAARTAGRSTREVIEAVVDAHLDAVGLGDCRHVVLKNSEIALNGDRAREVFPEIRGLHVIRDVRGVANSMINTRSPYKDGQPMGRGNVMHATRLWLNYLARVDKLDWPVLHVSYERLVAAPKPEAARAAAWLIGPEAGAPARSAGADLTVTDAVSAEGPGRFRIGEVERDMHRLAAGEGAVQRVEAWTSELPRWQVDAVEALAGREMIRRGYALSTEGGAPPRLSLRARSHDWGRRAMHWASSAGRLARWAISDRRMARIRLRQFFAQLQGRY